MLSIAKIISLLTLSLVIVPCLFLFAGMIELDTVKFSALVGTIGWFTTTPFWMSRELPIDAGEVEI